MTRRARRRVEGVAVLLAFPVAVGLTVLAIAPSSSGSAVTSFDGSVVRLVGADPIATYAVADRLSRAGYDVEGVSVSDNSLSAANLVVYYERERRGAAVRLRDLLGGGAIRLDHVLEPSSDLTVLLGKDPQRT